MDKMMNKKYILIGLLVLFSLSFVSAKEKGKNLKATQVTFPLSISANGRYFVDALGIPFLYNADTGWQLLYKLTKQESIEYFSIRKKEGFNVIQLQLSMDVNAPNRNGDTPFTDVNNFMTAQDAYHDYVKEIIGVADSMNLLIVLTYPWQGCCGEAYGTSADKPLQMNGPEKCRWYGEYLGKKFADCKNLMWIMGGDHNPDDDRESLEAAAKGLFATAPRFQYITYHASASFSSTDVWKNAEWLGFSFIYTYNRAKNRNPEVYEEAHDEYKKGLAFPFILGESQYEGDGSLKSNDIGTPSQVRRQAYWCLLSGGAGHAYGSDIWFFPEDWKMRANRYRGANQLRYFYDFFTAIDWQRLEPDMSNQFITDGEGDYMAEDYAVSAIDVEKKFAVVYIPRGRTFVCDLSLLEGLAKYKFAYLYNPRSGEYLFLGKFKKEKYLTVTPPDQMDWVLWITDIDKTKEKKTK